MNTILEEAEQYEFTNGKYGFIAGVKWQQEQDKIKNKEKTYWDILKEAKAYFY